MASKGHVIGSVPLEKEAIDSLASVGVFYSHEGGAFSSHMLCSGYGAAHNTSAQSSIDTNNLSDCPLPRYHALKPVKQGLIVKQGHNFRNWKRRLCALEANYLYYFVSEDDIAPRGVILLDNCEVREEPGISRERKTFCLSVSTIKSWNVSHRKVFTERRYYFCFPSSSELNDWMALLQQASTNMPRYSNVELF